MARLYETFPETKECDVCKKTIRFGYEHNGIYCPECWKIRCEEGDFEFPDGEELIDFEEEAERKWAYENGIKETKA